MGAVPHGHLGGLSDGGDESVVERRMLGHPVGGQHPCGRQIERQHTVREGRQDPLVEPPAQDPSLLRVGSFLGDHAPLDLGNGHGRPGSPAGC
ncbi:hypothetical protein EBESD8_54640 [Rhodococcus aetherivorans]|nr:hypothetical protein EBESD8_54640 [Rhodococcus aetherivorans]